MALASGAIGTGLKSRKTMCDVPSSWQRTVAALINEYLFRFGARFSSASSIRGSKRIARPETADEKVVRNLSGCERR